MGIPDLKLPAPAATAFPLATPLGMVLAMDNNRPVSDDARRELAALLPAIASGDRQAFARLYERTSAKLYGVALRILRNETEAEEVLQDVYVSVWRNAGRFKVERASPITWLAVLARNRAIDRIRGRRPTTASLDEAGDPASEDLSALELLENADDRKALDDCLDQLDESPRRAIVSAFLDGASHSQVAALEQVPLGTMKSRIRRALIALRNCLET
ncbi:MAG TPA: sigma-70 family RNA polymerase sigma factor [Sphingomicrobium sp.]|nr:sigma-70 family RNA polymerase sigma factor [Sphingomicrobium sp.]